MEIILQKKQNQILLYAIIITFIFGFFLRTYKLDIYPLQINQDELSNIYDGYCIAETGADRWGVKAPIILKGFGDFDNRPPLYSYLTAISVKIFGYSIISGRMPSAIIGCISLVLLFLVAQKIGGKSYGYICLLLAALSPWHLLFSRIAHEGAALPPFFLILTLYLLIIARESGYKNWLIGLLGLTVGLSTNAYQSTKIIFLLISIAICIKIFFKTNRNYSKAGIFIFCTFLGALPQVLALILYPDRFFARAADQLIPFSFSFNFFKILAVNILSNFDPRYLFLSFGEFNNLTIGRLLLVEVAYFYIGIWFFYKLFMKNNVIDIKLIYAFLFISLLPAAITQDNPHSLRTSVSVLLFPLFTGATIYLFLKKLEQFKLGKISAVVMGLLIILNSAYNIQAYVKSMPMRGQGQQYGQVAMLKKMKEYDQHFENVHIQLYGAFQYLFVASYCGITPAEYHLLEKDYTKKGWYQFKKLGKYQFMSNDDILKANQQPQNGKNLIVLLEKTNKFTLLDSLNYMGEKIYYYKN